MDSLVVFLAIVAGVLCMLGVVITVQECRTQSRFDRVTQADGDPSGPCFYDGTDWHDVAFQMATPDKSRITSST